MRQRDLSGARIVALVKTCNQVPRGLDAAMREPMGAEGGESLLDRIAA